MSKRPGIHVRTRAAALDARALSDSLFDASENMFGGKSWEEIQKKLAEVTNNAKVLADHIYDLWISSTEKLSDEEAKRLQLALRDMRDTP